VRLLAGKVRRLAFGGLHLHFLSCLDLDQRLGRRAVLPVGFEPDRAAQHGGGVFNWHG